SDGARRPRGRWSGWHPDAHRGRQGRRPVHRRGGALMAIDRIGAGVATAYPRSASPATRGPQGTSFADALSKASENLQISRHAQKRIDRRQLDFDPAGMVRLNSAISRAAEKGG